jgi:hypothetical protein
MSERTTSDVVQLVRRYLADVRLDDDIYLEVDEPHIRQGDNWWRVPVRLSRWPKRMFGYYTVLAEIEAEIAEKEKVNVLFSTGEPLTEAEEEQAEPAVAA